MAEETTVTETDIFQQQKKTIDTLVDVLSQQSAQQQQPVYVTPQQQEKSPNYVLYIGLAIAAMFFLKKGR